MTSGRQAPWLFVIGLYVFASVLAQVALFEEKGYILVF